MGDKVYADTDMGQDAVDAFTTQAKTFESEVQAAKAGLDAITWEDPNGQALAEKAKKTFEEILPKITENLQTCAKSVGNMNDEAESSASYVNNLSKGL